MRNFFLPQFFSPVATPHGSDKNATVSKKTCIGGEKNDVATPHGSDKNATLGGVEMRKNVIMLQLPTGQIKMQQKKSSTEQIHLFSRVATPHGSDKNATG